MSVIGWGSRGALAQPGFEDFLDRVDPVKTCGELAHDLGDGVAFVAASQQLVFAEGLADFVEAGGFGRG
jgi:hypothetical protein